MRAGFESVLVCNHADIAIGIRRKIRLVVCDAP